MGLEGREEKSERNNNLKYARVVYICSKSAAPRNQRKPALDARCDTQKGTQTTGAVVPPATPGCSQEGGERARRPALEVCRQLKSAHALGRSIRLGRHSSNKTAKSKTIRAPEGKELRRDPVS
jgi:hypothetical protein